MPHQITWTISPVSESGVEHELSILLDAREIKRGFITPQQSLEISFPRGPTFTTFRTVWCNAPQGSLNLREDWGHEIDPATGGRWYRIGYHHLIADMPGWDQQSNISLKVTTRQSPAWSAVANGCQFTFQDVKISPAVDGEICVLAPKPTGCRAHICEWLVYHLNLGGPHNIEVIRIPLLDRADQPVRDEKTCSVKFHLSSTRRVNDLQELEVTYSRGLVYGWLTSKKAILVVIGLGVVAYMLFQTICSFL